MQSFSPWSALGGGALIALGLGIMLVACGRIAGVSGVLGGILAGRRGDMLWRLGFVGGMLAGGLLMLRLRPGAFDTVAPRSLGALAVAGLLVGVGTRLANGCTSGHGVCGVSRLSGRSLLATGTFVAIGVAAAVLAGRVL